MAPPPPCPQNSQPSQSTSSTLSTHLSCMRVSPSPAANISDGRILPVADLPIICRQHAWRSSFPLLVPVLYTIELVVAELVAAVAATGPIPGVVDLLPKGHQLEARLSLPLLFKQNPLIPEFPHQRSSPPALLHLKVLKKCHLAEIVRRDPRLLDALGIITEYDE
ncbi:uncharacterized protein DS421_13g403840 [Arachis hypogaea]|nr:uncharacterized protein DS421_13g403840 [Arachis hypogaea]